MPLTPKERERWNKFKLGLPPRADNSEKKRVIIQMTREGKSVREIKEVVSCSSGFIGYVRLSERRRGVY